MAGPCIELTRRQLHLYTDQAVIFADFGDEPLVDRVTGEVIPTDPGPSRRGPFPCKYGYTQNVDDAIGVAREKRFTMLTADYVNFAVGTPVPNAAYIVNVTRLESGEKHANYGQVSKVLGAARIIPGAGRRSVNLVNVRVMQEEKPPDYILEFLTGDN